MTPEGKARQQATPAPWSLAAVWPAAPAACSSLQTWLSQPVPRGPSAPPATMVTAVRSPSSERRPRKGGPELILWRGARTTCSAASTDGPERKGGCCVSRGSPARRSSQMFAAYFCPSNTGHPACSAPGRKLPFPSLRRPRANAQPYVGHATIDMRVRRGGQARRTH